MLIKSNFSKKVFNTLLNIPAFSNCVWPILCKVLFILSTPWRLDHREILHCCFDIAYGSNCVKACFCRVYLACGSNFEVLFLLIFHWMWLTPFETLFFPKRSSAASGKWILFISIINEIILLEKDQRYNKRYDRPFLNACRVYAPSQKRWKRLSFSIVD